jgi:hypothetical protein
MAGMAEDRFDIITWATQFSPRIEPLVNIQALLPTSMRLQVDMERHGALGRFRMCAVLMLRPHALKVGHVVIGGKKIAVPGAKKRGR